MSIKSYADVMFSKLLMQFLIKSFSPKQASSRSKVVFKSPP